MTAGRLKTVCTVLFAALLQGVSAMESADGLDRIDLQGAWQLTIGDKTYQVTLPGTTDEWGIGEAPQNMEETTHLTRLHSYKGEAVYSRQVTLGKAWQGKRVRLFVERTKPATVYVDGVRADYADRLSTAQVFDLTEALGRQKTWPLTFTLTVKVDNGKGIPEQIYGSSHAETEDTQTNWNGMIGAIRLVMTGKAGVKDWQVFPDAATGRVAVKVRLCAPLPQGTSVRLSATPQTFHGKESSTAMRTARQQDVIEMTLQVEDFRRWSEFHPDYYWLRLDIDGQDTAVKPFGFRLFTPRDHHFYVNDTLTFLRGKHDACVWPLTAHVPMDTDAWRKYLTTCRQYGINFIRFHSWCPPEAAFKAADELGMYLQPELPFWGDFKASDEVLMTYLHAEGEAILREYGHHPSFVLFALGNELWGSFDKMAEFIRDFRAIDSTKHYTYGSNYFLGYEGVRPEMDYFTTCRVGGEAWGTFTTHVRGSFAFADAYDGGLINHTYPNSSTTLQTGCSLSSVPVMSHETGQFQTYPDYDEIKKYTGVLYPYNLEVFRRRLEEAGMGDQAKAFQQASGRWSAELYKADIEMDLRTPNMAGFQLLDLQDYPGQGTALVGILDAFMDSKGLVTEDEWRQWCSPVVPLLVTDGFCYTSRQRLSARIEIANYGGHSLRGKDIRWQMGGQSGLLRIESPELGLVRVGRIDVDLSGYRRPTQEKLTLSIVGTSCRNTYPIWIYPADEDLGKLEKKLIITRKMSDDVVKKLQQGKKVLWIPDSTCFKESTVGALFQTDYWNYRMFKTICENNKKPVSPGTMGILADADQPLLREFPNEGRTSWQWFPVIKASRPLVLDNLPQDYRPLVQVIDNVERNHKLGLVFEFAVGKGKLLVCMSDLSEALYYPEGRQFYVSLLRYMNSSDFRPSYQVKWPELFQALSARPGEAKIKELNNISNY